MVRQMSLDDRFPSPFSIPDSPLTEIKKISDSLCDKYGWEWGDLDSTQQSALFLVITPALEIMKNRKAKVNTKLLCNRIKFLCSYIISDTIGFIWDDLIKDSKIKFECISEFSLHWRRGRAFLSSPSLLNHGFLMYFLFMLMIGGLLIVNQACVFQEMTDKYCRLYYSAYELTSRFLPRILSGDLCISPHMDINRGYFTFFLVWGLCLWFSMRILILCRQSRRRIFIPLVSIGIVSFCCFAFAISVFWMRCAACLLIAIVIQITLCVCKYNYLSLEEPYRSRIRRYLTK